MPLCPQITNTPVTVSQTGDFTVASVVPAVSDTIDGLAQEFTDIVVDLDGKTKAYYQNDAPVGDLNEGDIWFDTNDGNKQYFYNGTAWVSVQDTAIAAAQAAATAAQTTADGKNKVYRQTTMPTAGPFAEGDLWFDTDDDNKFYRYTGGAFSSFTLGDNALASLSANKITAGTIDASVITVSNLNAGNISTGTLNADRIASASITGTKIAAGTITASNIATATITATQIAAGTITTDKLVAGTLTGFTVQTSSGNDAVILNGSSNAIQIKANGSVVTNMLNFSTSGALWHYGSTPTSGGTAYPLVKLTSTSASIEGGSSAYFSANAAGNTVVGATTYSGGTHTFSNVLTASSDFNANSVVYMPNLTTTANAANMRVGTGAAGEVFESTASSQQFKENIVNIETVFDLDPKKLLDLPVRAFTYKDSYLPTTDDRSGVMIPGFIAEEVDAIYTIAADYEANGPRSWNERYIIPGLLALIQDLYKEVQTLKGE